VITAFIGCAYYAPKTPTYFASEYGSQTPWIRKVALIVDTKPPEIESVILGVTRGEGAARGAGHGVAEGLRGLNGCSGGACVLLVPIVIVSGAIVGSVSGAMAGYPADVLAEAEANARQALDSASLQTQLIDNVANYGNTNLGIEFIHILGTNIQSPEKTPDYKTLRNKSIDVVLELELIRLSLHDSLNMVARARLISVSTGTVISDNRYLFNSESHKLDEWMANGAAPLTDAMDRGLQTLAEDIVDENFLLFYPKGLGTVTVKESGAQTGQTQTVHSKAVPLYVLSPVYPRLEHSFWHPDRTIGTLDFVEVDSVQPILRWERFPRDYDIPADDGQNHPITDVRYDLRVFEAVGRIPGQLVYEVRDLPEPYVKIQSGLKACSDYYWTVRARFKLDGRIRATEWAGAFSADGWNEQPWRLRRFGGRPQMFYYPFSSPCD
jgi:hypothetical protein